MTPKKKTEVEENEAVTKGVADYEPEETATPEQLKAVESVEPQTGDRPEPTEDVPEPRPSVALYSHPCGVVATGPKKRCPGCGAVQQLGDTDMWKRFDVLLA